MSTEAHRILENSREHERTRGDLMNPLGERIKAAADNKNSSRWVSVQKSAMKTKGWIPTESLGINS